MLGLFLAADTDYWTSLPRERYLYRLRGWRKAVTEAVTAASAAAGGGAVATERY